MLGSLLVNSKPFENKRNLFIIILAIICIVVLVFGFTSIGSSEDSNKSESSGKSKKTEKKTTFKLGEAFTLGLENRRAIYVSSYVDYVYGISKETELSSLSCFPHLSQKTFSLELIAPQSHNTLSNEKTGFCLFLISFSNLL